MLQPFYIFRPLFIEKFIALGKKYFVAQSYARGQSDASKINKTSILLSDYDDLGLARGHLAAIKHDKFASIIDATNEKHLEKLKEIVSSGSKYLVFWNAVQSAEKLNLLVKKQYKLNTMRYISTNTQWHIGRDENLQTSVELEFGNLFIVIRRGAHMLRVPLEKIEKA